MHGAQGALIGVAGAALLLTACGQEGPQERSAGGKTVAAKAPSASKATTTTTTTAAAALDTRPTSMVPPLPGKADLCAPGEKRLFSCRLQNGKTASVCAAAEAGGGRFPQYRYGNLKEESELVFPEHRGGGAIRFVSVPYSGGGEAQLSFTRGAYRYVVYSRVVRTNFTAGEPNDPQFDDGVLVMKDGKIIQDHGCSGEALYSVDYAFSEKYAEPADQDALVDHPS
tara:strand:+ start:622 stop:1299 length:678 start_codon:yes stop_codon:yes gene_type:complete